MDRIRGITFRHIQRPLKTTFATALGKKDVINSVFVRVALQSGRSGEGEIPTSFAFRDETVPAIDRALRGVVPGLKGMPVEDYPGAVRKLRRQYPQAVMTISGLEIALFRAWLNSENRNETGFWNGGGLPLPAETYLKTDITVPYTERPDRLTAWLKTCARLGFTEFKVKLSGRIDSDFNYLDRIDGFLRSRLVEGFKIRLDGNQGYTKDSFLKFMERCSGKSFPLELVEQPLPKNEFAPLRNIRRNIPVPIILDEGVRSVDDLSRALEAEACDGINIKLAKSGVGETVQIMKRARAGGLKLMIGCMTETMTGLSAALRLAAGSAAFDYLDLDSIFFLFNSKTFRQEEFRDIRLDGPIYKVSLPSSVSGAD